MLADNHRQIDTEDIIHKLYHLKIHNHSPAFYRLLTRCMPAWKQRKELLERFVQQTSEARRRGGIVSASFPAKKLASPFSTGGGGDDLQGQVEVFYLAGLLTGHVPRGLEVGTLEEVRFQRLYESEFLDDLVCVAGIVTGLGKLSLQIKSDFTFGEKDGLFIEVIAACWRTFNSPKFDRTRDRFGIVLGIYKGKIDEHYECVLTWARNSASTATFLARSVKRGYPTRTTATS